MSGMVLSRDVHPKDKYPWNAETPMSWMELSSAVSHWSFYNFGLQISKTTGVELNAEAPFKGIMEEYLEYQLARYRNQPEEIIDSLCDMVVYLMDYSARHNIDLTLDQKTKDNLWVSITFSEGFRNLEYQLLNALELFVRTDLKSHQGIRGFTFQEMPVVIFKLLGAISAVYFNYKYGKTAVPDSNIVVTVLDALKEETQNIFFNTVYQRNWVKYPGSGKPQ